MTGRRRPARTARAGRPRRPAHANRRAPVPRTARTRTPPGSRPSRRRRRRGRRRRRTPSARAARWRRASATRPPIHGLDGEAGRRQPPRRPSVCVHAWTWTARCRCSPRSCRAGPATRRDLRAGRRRSEWHRAGRRAAGSNELRLAPRAGKRSQQGLLSWMRSISVVPGPSVVLYEDEVERRDPVLLEDRLDRCRVAGQRDRMHTRGEEIRVGSRRDVDDGVSARFLDARPGAPLTRAVLAVRRSHGVLLRIQDDGDDLPITLVRLPGERTRRVLQAQGCRCRRTSTGAHRAGAASCRP